MFVLQATNQSLRGQERKLHKWYLVTNTTRGHLQHYQLCHELLKLNETVKLSPEISSIWDHKEFLGNSGQTTVKDINNSSSLILCTRPLLDISIFFGTKFEYVNVVKFAVFEILEKRKKVIICKRYK